LYIYYSLWKSDGSNQVLWARALATCPASGGLASEMSFKGVDTVTHGAGFISAVY